MLYIFFSAYNFVFEGLRITSFCIFLRLNKKVLVEKDVEILMIKKTSALKIFNFYNCQCCKSGSVLEYIKL